MVCAFDLDGTLFDNSDLLVPSLEISISEFTRVTGITREMPSRETITGVIGYPMRDIFRRLVPGVDMKHADTMIDLFMGELIRRVRGGGGYLYDGVSELLHRLSDEGYTLLVASNGTAAYIRAVLEHYSLDKLFSEPILVVDDKTIHSKADIVSEYKESHSGTGMIMIGDRETDRDAALHNGIPFVYCTYGHARSGEIGDEAFTADHPSHIYQKIKVIERKISI
ncbi:MAG: HAD family hydrolase [Spirochaetota bacterium]